jgi:hypothetical protein
MDLEKIETKYRALREQSMASFGATHSMAEQLGIPLENVFVGSAPDKSLSEIEPFRQMEKDRQAKLTALPPELRAAVMRCNEICDLLNGIQMKLVRTLFLIGVSVAAIAKRVELEEDSVRLILDSFVRDL